VLLRTGEGLTGERRGRKGTRERKSRRPTLARLSPKTYQREVVRGRKGVQGGDIQRALSVGGTS